ncbi:hypothetical protein GCM10023238_39160 [Streptomyces heliomycini]
MVGRPGRTGGQRRADLLERQGRVLPGGGGGGVCRAEAVSGNRSRSGNTHARKSRNAQHGRREVGRDEDRQLGGVGRVAGGGVQRGERAAGQGETDAEDDQPCAWCRTAPPRPRTPKVSRRLAAVLATAETSRASPLAVWEPVKVRKPL